METLHFLDLFQGIATLVASEPKIMIGRILLMLLGFILIYLGSKGVLEPLLMIPMGLGMSSINAGVMSVMARGYPRPRSRERPLQPRCSALPLGASAVLGDR